MRRVALLLALTLPLSGCFDGGSRNNFVFDCTKTVQQPRELVLYCSDAGQTLRNIRWFNWGESSATGQGTVYTKLCDPNCTEGQVSESDVKVTLMQPRDVNGQSVFTTIQLLYTTPPAGHPRVENVTLATEAKS